MDASQEMTIGDLGVIEGVETSAQRYARLCPTEQNSEQRMESLQLAHAAGITDSTYMALSTAKRLNRKSTIVLPIHHLESKSRGSGWARLGRGDSVSWGEREDAGYRVGPGRWTVGGNDGFRRKDETIWNVKNVKVGSETWTIAS